MDDKESMIGLINAVYEELPAPKPKKKKKWDLDSKLCWIDENKRLRWKNSNIDISKVNINYSVEFAALSGSFISGVGDYVNLFEPNATNLEKQEYGYVVESVGKLSGEVPYTAFYARNSYLNDNKELLEKFTKAIDKGLKFVQENDAKTCANVILNQFPEISKNDLTKIIDRYKKYDSWLENPFISEESFKNLEDIMIDAKILDKYVPYDKLITNLYNE